MLILLLLAMIAAQMTGAQEALCEDIVARALTSLAEQCEGLERNSLCYAHEHVDATTIAGASNLQFDKPGARAPLSSFTSLETSRLDLSSGQWGAAVMNLQANLPATKSGSGVIILLLGSVQIENEVRQDLVVEIQQPLSTVAIDNATRFAQPAKIAEAVGQLEKDEITLVDAFNSTGDWLRVVTDGSVSWVESERLARLQAMSTLPIVEAGDRFAWQAFAFSSGAGFPECDTAEPQLGIQTPADLSANLTINGVDIHIDSLVSFQQVHPNALSMTVHRGSATTIFGNTILAGNTVIGVMGTTAERDSTILDWSGALPVSERELARGERLQNALNGLARSNNWNEFETKMTAGDLIHVVVSGDTLYGLARQYDVRVAVIVAANDILAPSRLYIGTELLIPNPGSGFGGFGSTTPPPAPVAARPKAQESAAPDCSGLRLTSPRDVALGGISTYYWDGIAAASGYRINVFDHGSDALVGNFNTSRGETSISFSAGQLGVGGALQWEVIALADGQPICSTGRSDPLPHVSS